MAKDKLSKEEKKRLKQQKKAAHAADMDTEESGGKLGVALVTVFIVAVWLGIFAFLIKVDVGGFGSTVLYPILKDVPVVSAILPTVTNPEDLAADADYPYDTLTEAVEQIKSLELQLKDAQDQLAAKDESISELNTEISRLKAFEVQQTEFQSLKADFDESVVFNDNAPDISEYRTYYESIDPTNAEQLYKQVIQQTEYSDEVKEYAKAYGAMKPKQAAGIFEQMTNNLELVAEILENMSADARGDILGAMDPKIAAKVTKILAP